MAQTVPKLVVRTAKIATGLMASASLVAFLNGQEHTVKRDVRMLIIFVV